MNAPVCVIIAAYNASATIGCAVRSALAQSEVGEVIVVDDGSNDNTGRAATASAGSDPRLVVLRQPRNGGPSAARNHALAATSMPYVAILDADDYILPGRFTHLLSIPGWDMIADNIVFVPENDAGDHPAGPEEAEVRALTLEDFVAGNLTDGNERRGEMGFLKPLMRRAFLEENKLRYDTIMRLGEDYDLYVRALLKGARFQLSHRVGYAARVRAGSLSGVHSTDDLSALLAATEGHRIAAAQNPRDQAAIEIHQRQIRDRYVLRAFLDRKAAAGLGGALRFALSPPANMVPIAAGVMRDKMAALRGAPRGASPVGRVLLN
ncbi:MAG: glycosyltransferase family 2 protein [Pseudomonadota bacterium]